ncbi:DUF3558 domain-containing protein [Saccharomonospora xinjiangensis]|uniref:DUF3558 domain-containing protein n=1 Tax=Saccharomonospora xinjiangensis TaxID=75294 RepID=UPI00350ED017
MAKQDMKRYAFAPLMLTGILLLGTGCGSTSGGIAQPTPASTSPQASHTASDASPPGDEPISLSIDPCSLLDADTDLAEVGTFQGPDRKDRAGARSCTWQLEPENAAAEGLVIALDVRDDQTVDDLTDVGGGVKQGEINNRPAAEAPDPAYEDCTLAIELDAASRIDVGIAAMDDVNDACDVARDIAYLVEPRLPKP